VTGSATPPRDPNNDDDYGDEDEKARFAEGATIRQTAEVLANLAKERPEIMNMHAGKVYLAECRSPLTADSSVQWAFPDCPKALTRKQRGPGPRLGTSSAKT